MNKVIFTFSVIVSAALGYFAGKNSHGPAIEATVLSTSPQTLAKKEEGQGVASRQIENNFHLAVASSSSKAPAKPAFPIAEDAATQQQIAAVKAEYEFRQRSEAFTQWLTKNQKEKAWFDLGVEMRGRFDAEETDHNWALGQESHLQSLFSQAPALAGVALKSTRCKSTQCQITVSVMDNNHANETAMAISQVLGSEGSTQVIIDNQAQQGEAILYVARDEKGFEFN